MFELDMTVATSVQHLIQFRFITTTALHGGATLRLYDIQSVLLYVELTPTQLHIFEVVTTRDAASSSSQPSQSGDAGNFTKGEVR